MEIYLIRHTTPEVIKGTCYGQSDLGVTPDFEQEAEIIRGHLPSTIERVYSSPLLRCRVLAEHLFEPGAIEYHDDLMEIHCGDWEMRMWDTIDQGELEPWMNDFVNRCFPGGESYVQLFERTNRRFEAIRERGQVSAIVSHGGVMRSILSGLTGTALKDSFKVFGLHYGAVVRLREIDGRIEYEFLSNIPPVVKEQHKPSSMR